MMRFCRGRPRRSEGPTSERGSVAVVGASTDPQKYGNRAVRAYKAEGWDVYPIHPGAESIGGLPVFRSVAAVPVRLTRVSLYLPPALGIEVLPEIAAAEPEEFYVNPGAESDELVARARELGLEPILACSILAIGREPDRL